MISDALVLVLKSRFPELVFEEKRSPEPVITIHSANSILGDLCIYDDGGEATLVIGKITHSHFNPYEPELSQEELDQRVAADVADFLDALFKDQVLMWVGPDGNGGGWKYLEFLEDGSQWEKEFSPDGQFYLWSGPVNISSL